MENFKILIEPDFLKFTIQILATIVLFLVLRHFLFEPISEMLEKRKAYVESNIAESEKAKVESLQLKKEYDKQLLEAKESANELIANARVSGEEIKAKAVLEAKEEAKRVYDKNMENLDREKEKVLKSMNDEIVDMAILAAEKVLVEEVDPKTNKKMLNSFLKDMEA